MYKRQLLQSDVEALERLFSPMLVFVNHLGQRLTREDTLAIHRSDRIRIDSLLPSDAVVRVAGEVGVVSVRTHINGVYNEQETAGDYRFMRVWRLAEGGALQLIAAQATPAAD